MECRQKRGLELEEADQCREGACRGVVGYGILGGAERYSERRGRMSLGEVGEMGAQPHPEQQVKCLKADDA